MHRMYLFEGFISTTVRERASGLSQAGAGVSGTRLRPDAPNPRLASVPVSRESTPI